MTPAVQRLAAILRLNNTLFIQALAGIPGEHITRKTADPLMPIRQLAAQVIWSRYSLLHKLGSPVAANPYAGLFISIRSLLFSTDGELPTLENIRLEWNKTIPLIDEALATVTEEDLAADISLNSPADKHSGLGATARLVQHESYDLGQMAILRNITQQPFEKMSQHTSSGISTLMQL